MSDLGNKKIFSKNLKYYMELNRKDRNDICRDLGFKYSTVTDWINGNIYPRIDKIEMLANYFHIEKSDLIEEKSTESIENNAYFRVMQTAKEKGYTPEDLKLAMDFLDRARKRDTTDEN